MDKILELFEKSLAEYHAGIGKKDNLVGTGEILLEEFRKQRDQVVTLGKLLSDFYSTKPQDHKAMTANMAEIHHINAVLWRKRHKGSEMTPGQSNSAHSKVVASRVRSLGGRECRLRPHLGLVELDLALSGRA